MRLIAINLCIILFFTGCFVRPASDENMMQFYFSHVSEFEQLNQKILFWKTKGLNRIDMDWTDPQDLSLIGMSEETLSGFRSDFQNLGIERGTECYGTGIEYLSYIFGISVSGFRKGYYYSEKEPENASKIEIRKKFYMHTDKKIIPVSGSYIVYTRISEKWYLVEEYDD